VTHVPVPSLAEGWHIVSAHDFGARTWHKGFIGVAVGWLAHSSGCGNICTQLIDEAEGLDKIEELQNHSHEDIYDKAVLILETYFDVEDGEAENLAPQVQRIVSRAACA